MGDYAAAAKNLEAFSPMISLARSIVVDGQQVSVIREAVQCEVTPGVVGEKGVHNNFVSRLRPQTDEAGQETAEIYAGLPAAAQEPPHRLVGWQKIALAAGESKTVSVRVEPLYLSIYNVDKNGWQLVPGSYTIRVGGSSRDLPLKAAVTLEAR
jgi:Fibronectin type III-like domain